MTMTGDGERTVVVRADPTLIAQAMAEHVTTIVAATMQFLLLNPASWVSGLIEPGEREEIELAMSRLLGLRAADLADGPCPLCQHDDCIPGCPVSAARTLVRRI